MADLVQGQGAPLASWAPEPQPRPYLVPQHEAPEQTTQTAQASAEGVVLDDGDYLEFFGEKFRLADRVGIIPMLAFANASKKGLDSDDMEGLAAMYAMIRGVIHRPPLFNADGTRSRDENGKPLRDESEWQRFEALAEDECAEGDDVMSFVNKAMEVMAARPRKPREISSDGSRPTSESSRAGSSLPGTLPGAEGLTPVSRLGR